MMGLRPWYSSRRTRNELYGRCLERQPVFFLFPRSLPCLYSKSPSGQHTSAGKMSINAPESFHWLDPPDPNLLFSPNPCVLMEGQTQEVPWATALDLCPASSL